MVGIDECDVLLNTAGPYSTFVPDLGTKEPMTTASSHGSDIQIVAVTHGPHGHRLSQGAVPPDGRDLHFFRVSGFVELVARPTASWARLFRPE